MQENPPQQLLYQPSESIEPEEHVSQWDAWDRLIMQANELMQAG